MVRPNRVKELRFASSDLIASAGGIVTTFNSQPGVANGTIQKIEYLGGNYTATGSIQIKVSGTGELVHGFTSGTAGGNAAGGVTSYPFVYSQDNSNTTGSPHAFSQRVINAPLQVIGSGLGNAKSGLGIVVYYI